MEALTLPGKLDSLSAIAKYVMEASKLAGLEKKAAYKLRLAVDEIVTNIITHGYEEAGLEGQITVCSQIQESTLTICIEDTGARYDPYEQEAVKEEELNKPLEERPIGGLGVYLAIQGVDKYFYERVEDKNHNIFVVNCKTTN
jgi:anti-sigma regulatory factor (Ser/Thr protein kinase)